jgi:hypothetical protein
LAEIGLHSVRIRHFSRESNMINIFVVHVCVKQWKSMESIAVKKCILQLGPQLGWWLLSCCADMPILGMPVWSAGYKGFVPCGSGLLRRSSLRVNAVSMAFLRTLNGSQLP